MLPAAGGGLAVAAMWARAAYRRDLAGARARVSTGSEIAQTDCGPIEYAVRGEGPPVLVVHGAGGGFDQGLSTGRMLDGFRVIAPSRFGYLGTPLPRDASPEAQADALACLLYSLEVDRAAVVAFSAGAPSAMQLCLRHPDRCSALVLLVPLAWMDRPTPSARMSRAMQSVVQYALHSDLVYWTATHVLRGAMTESILGTPLADVERSSTADQRRVDDMLELVLPISLREKGLRNDQHVAQTLHRYELERMTVPTLVIGVENCLYKTYEPARYTAKHIPGARFISYPDGGHLGVGHDAEISAEVRQFLAAAPAVQETMTREPPPAT